MMIFGTKSPFDRLGGSKPKAVKLKPGKLKKLAQQMGPLLETKSLLDKVYSNGYFENHYPDADQLLKNTLHERVMQSWAFAKGFTPDSQPSQGDGENETENEEKNINVVINIG